MFEKNIMRNKFIAAALIINFLATLIISCARQPVAAPAFSLTDINGKEVALSDFKGQKAVLLLFFNFNLGTGQDPVLQSYLKKYRETPGIQVYGVVDYSAVPDQGRKFMAAHGAQNQGGLGFAIPLKDEDGAVSRQYGASREKLTLVLVNREGFIIFRQEVTSVAEDNTELARYVAEIAK
jgi:peroxiredoxin